MATKARIASALLNCVGSIFVDPKSPNFRPPLTFQSALPARPLLLSGFSSKARKTFSHRMRFRARSHRFLMRYKSTLVFSHHGQIQGNALSMYTQALYGYE